MGWPVRALARGYCVAINPLAVATIQRLPQRTIDSIRPIPGIVSPRVAIRIPSGPSSTAVPSRTSTTLHPGMVVGLVSGAAAKGGLIATATPAGLALAWEAKAVLDGSADRRAPAGAAAEGLEMLPTVAGAAVRRSGVDAVFRGPSVLPADFASAIRGEGASFWATWPRPIRFAASGQFRAPAHPSPKLAASAIVTNKTVRARPPYGPRTTRWSSRSRLKTSHRPAGCLGDAPSATSSGEMCSRVLGSRSCMA